LRIEVSNVASDLVVIARSWLAHSADPEDWNQGHLGRDDDLEALQTRAELLARPWRALCLVLGRRADAEVEN
jgi:hypothetical protein